MTLEYQSEGVWLGTQLNVASIRRLARLHCNDCDSTGKWCNFLIPGVMLQGLPSGNQQYDLMTARDFAYPRNDEEKNDVL
ncbi:unnamed protein product, partial [Mesorhabditis belari]|uniref:Uncharacterized protein n=1 Tax=Mesorhabditis belari TaxID=2138241 RepID=A0AAF3EI89_9BILA